MDTEIIEQFIESLKIKGLRKITIDEYRWNLNDYSQYLLIIPLYSFFAATEETIAAYYFAVKEKQFRPRTVWKKQHAVYALYEWLKESGMLLVNPAPKPAVVVIKQLPRAIPVHALLVDAHKKLTGTESLGEQRDQVIIDLAYSCGLRRCELHALDINDINESDGTVRVQGKGGKERVVPIGPKALENLRHYVYHIRPKFLKCSTTSALFISWRKGGTRINARSINIALRRLHNKYGIARTITPHALRHAYATELLRAGAPVQDVSEMLGHVKLETTQVYTRVAVRDLKNHHAAHHPRG